MFSDDVSRVAAIHAKAFPGFFLTSLGNQFLEHFYSACCHFDDGVALVAEHDQRVVGFIVGATNHRHFHRYLRRHWLVKFAMATVTRSVRNPTILARSLRALLSSGPQAPKATGALLMSVAVDPTYEGKGVGRELVAAFGAALSARGCSTFRLTTDRHHNDRANAFYVGAGFVLEDSYCTPQNRWMNQYIRVLDNSNLDRLPSTQS